VTLAVPKQLLPLLDKPAIHYAVEEVVASGIETLVIVISAGSHSIADYFDDASDLERVLTERGKFDLVEIVRQVEQLISKLDIVYVQQREPLGLGHAVWTARHLVEDEPFAVILPDDIFLGARPSLAQLIEAHERSGATILAARRVPRKQVSRYGVVATGGGPGPVHQVIDFIEKPAVDDAPSDLAVLGRYVLNPDVLAELERTEPGTGGEIQLPDAIRKTIRPGAVEALEFEGDYYDLGTVPGYLKANLALGLRREDLRDELLELIRELAGERVLRG
jgi:UTP--glucose-1-phosphate uridylyltransferase